MDRNLSATDDALQGMNNETDTSLIESHREQLGDLKRELTAIYEDLLALDLDEADELFA